MILRMILRLLNISLFTLFVAAISASADPLIDPIKPGLTEEEVKEGSIGCFDCHTKTDAPSMHTNPAVQIGCAHCHGGDPKVRLPNNTTLHGPEYNHTKKLAHVSPRHPENWPTSANPKRSYSNLLKESPEFVKFMNPGDLRVAPETCGGCHAETVVAVKRSLMTTSAMFFGGASYNNNILPYKNYILGESYTRDGIPQAVIDESINDRVKGRGALNKLVPLPQWETLSPGDNFRIFERGGLFIKSQFPEIGNPNPLEELNIHKTRLNDPHLSLMGTNDHPGDYRNSGCTSCHVIYGNDRDERHSGPYAKFGHEGKTQTKDPTIPKDEEGHPISHVFTRAIPTSQCMICHMHQPNMFVNTYLGYTMWDYESDAPHMWPEKQKYPTAEERFQSLSHNPEDAASRGNWTDIEFLKKVSELNPKLDNTQFADYHGHGWNFRAIFKRDRKGNLLDKKGTKVTDTDPQKFKKAVHLSDIHLDKGMHCVDCHFGQDNHGDGHIYGEVAQSVEITCEDCHGTVKERSTLLTSGPASPDGGNDLTLARTPFGKPRFEWHGSTLIQRSNLYKDKEWKVKQVRDIVDAKSPWYNEKAAKAKLVKTLGPSDTKPGYASVSNVLNTESGKSLLAHDDTKVACFTCHSSWVTSCAGCHLPIEANWKQKSKHYDGKETRNWASYNPQVARDDMFQIGRHGPAKDGKIVPIRSSSALVLSSTDINRQKIYVQQPPTAASGHSSQAFAPHFPHTVRTTETKQCADCHVSKKNDNNAIMAQLQLFGTNFVNFIGYHAYVATGDSGLEAVQVTEWDEPQAVIGSYLHRYAYPDFFKAHQDKKLELTTSHPHHGAGGVTNTIQLRGEYLYTTAGTAGFRVYDVANIANKGFSERIVTSPVSPLGQDTHVSSKNATSFALPTTMPIAPFRDQLPENLETKMHPIYHYAVIVDSVEGLILVNVDTLADFEPRNNFLKRALTWNEDGILNGATHIELGGTNAFVSTPESIVILDLDNPLSPKVRAEIPFNNPTASRIQFRYLFVTDKDGFHSVDITDIDKPIKVKGSLVSLSDARNIYLARTYAYVSGGKEGLVIIDIEKADKPKLYMKYNDDGTINDLSDVKVATTNASLFAYLADGINGFKILQLTDPERVPTYYGFSPEVKPKLIALKHTHGPALAISKGLDRDRAVDETGHQVSVFGRIGSRPLNLTEMQSLYLNKDKKLFTVK